MAVYTNKITEKNYMLYLHLQLVKFKNCCIYEEIVADDEFQEYYELNITPFSLDELKKQRQAVFVLGTKLVRALEKKYGAPKLIEEFESRSREMHGLTGIIDTLLEKYGLPDKEALQNSSMPREDEMLSSGQ